MHLSIATTPRPATDLGFLLMKHPERMPPFELGPPSQMATFSR
jgi:hypothetical protein